jgi:hypothetical protein
MSMYIISFTWAVPTYCRDGNAHLKKATGCETGDLDEGGQVTKGVWGMSWRKEAMKDVVSCDKPGGAAHKPIPGSPNGTTWLEVI